MIHLYCSIRIAAGPNDTIRDRDFVDAIRMVMVMLVDVRNDGMLALDVDQPYDDAANEWKNTN